MKKYDWSGMAKARRAKLADKGLCVWCGKHPHVNASKLCDDCTDKRNLRGRNRNRLRAGIPLGLPPLKPWQYAKGKENERDEP